MVCVSIRNDFVSWQLTSRFAVCVVLLLLGGVQPIGVHLNYGSEWEEEMTLLWEAIH